MFSGYIETHNSITNIYMYICKKNRILVDIYPRKIYNDQKVHRKMLNIISHQGNRCQNY